MLRPLYGVMRRRFGGLNFCPGLRRNEGRNVRNAAMLNKPQ